MTIITIVLAAFLWGSIFALVTRLVGGWTGIHTARFRQVFWPHVLAVGVCISANYVLAITIGTRVDPAGPTDLTVVIFGLSLVICSFAMWAAIRQIDYGGLLIKPRGAMALAVSYGLFFAFLITGATSLVAQGAL